MLAVTILICFSGMDIVYAILFEGWDWIELSVDLDGWPIIGLGHAFLDMGWGVAIQYLPNTFSLMWTPQHFISAALYALLLVQLRRQPRFLAVSGVVLAASLFWSPLVALGLLPLVGVLLLENGLRPFLRWPNLLLALPLAGLLGVYLTNGAADIPQGWLWERYEWPLLERRLPVFYLVEFQLLVLLLWLLRPQLRREPFCITSLVVLLLLPWYYLGIWNDFVTRVSLPALFLVCWYCADALAGRWPELKRKGGGSSASPWWS